MKDEEKNAKEAKRIVGNMCKMVGYHGTTTMAIADIMLRDYNPVVICNGFPRRMVFTPVGKLSVRFQTEPA